MQYVIPYVLVTTAEYRILASQTKPFLTVTNKIDVGGPATNNRIGVITFPGMQL